MNKNNLIKRLCHIGIEISAEKNIDTLLEMILKESMQIANCDAGSIYFIEGEQEQCLTFKYTQNLSIEFPFKSFRMAIDKNSIAGACAVTGELYNFTSMDETVDKIGIRHNPTFDDSVGYRTRNMLVVPLKNYDEEVIGVMQLINKKKGNERLVDDLAYETILPFTEFDEEVIESLASQVAILIERTRLYESIQDLLESMTQSLAKAVDQRDPVTGGHSERVANYTLDLAKHISEAEDKSLASFDFTTDKKRELYYASMLHDVGKIGVPEYLLTKESKLPEEHMYAIEARYKYLMLLLKIRQEKMLDTADPNSQRIQDMLLDGAKILSRVNKAGFLREEDERFIEELKTYKIEDEDGSVIDLLTPYEYDQLSIKRGNITSEERSKINSHAQKTFEILDEINWTKSLSKVPVIASQHHEKLNGKGYPYGITSDTLSYEAKIMAIADIFDALTAKDRPYKPALSVEKSLSILKEEVANGNLDRVLVDHFENMILERGYPHD
ncbi:MULTISPECIES: HD-GYP domain-containing protein [unclassified Fusibacter]|uniref:HD-GYP domain-containing protein n=1 Tax=unclassified Fusibacter TaxID=2624464 RepID=UPI001010B526|nr:MULTISPECIES: HD family phosphohydrolase [unclassified Fusibacter]MCK8057998.1 GAF domain-containing protein [Fusibacter sp. A2]NPE20580.1 GAF domain-containing protein [Fusibacter sp. A1]RXV62787.1 GAF domain-containing protein [Fusibacter sp. A1]